MQAKLLQLCPTLCDPMDCSCQAPLSMGFSRQESWSGLPCPPSGNLPNLGIEPTSLMSPALAGRFFTTSTTWEAPAGRVKFGKSEPQHHGTSTSMDVELELSRCDKWFKTVAPSLSSPDSAVSYGPCEPHLCFQWICFCPGSQSCFLLLVTRWSLTSRL